MCPGLHNGDRLKLVDRATGRAAAGWGRRWRLAVEPEEASGICDMTKRAVRAEATILLAVVNESSWRTAPTSTRTGELGDPPWD